MKNNNIKKDIKEMIYVPDSAYRKISEQLSGEVQLNEIKFPKIIGEEHPFKFEIMEGIYKKFGYATSAVDKHVDFIAGTEFRIKSENEKAEKIINNWIEDSNFRIILRDWLKESLIKGNGFIEIDNKLNEIKILNANNIYIERNKRGEILGYNQYVGNYDKFNPTKIIPFSPNQIIHLPFNKVGDSAYGIGIIYPAVKYIDYVLNNDKNMHVIVDRKANSPYHIIIGTAEEPAQTGDIAGFGAKLEYLNNLHEWVTDHRVNIKTIDFGNLGEKFASIIEHDTEFLMYTFQVPEVLMGKGNIPEGLAEVQMDAFERRIKSIQTLLERIIEEKIFKQVLMNNGLNAKVEFEWNLPSDKDINDKIDRIQRLLLIPTLSPQMQSLLELELAKVMELDDDYLSTPEQVTQKQEQQKAELKTELDKMPKERDKEEKTPMPPIPENVDTCRHLNEYIEDRDYELEEWINFRYKDYLKSILKSIDKEKFIDLLAENTEQLDLGKLNENDIDKLRVILKDGFKKGKSIRTISTDIKDNINPPDRYTINENGEKVLSKSANERPIAIARTETLRMANHGMIDNYKNNGIKKVSWLATVSDRTCPICLGLNGQIMNNEEYLTKRNEIHPYCRCTATALIE